MKCEKCNKKHDGTFGSGRFCSESCAKSRSHNKQTREKIASSVAAWAASHPHELHKYTCEKCGKAFESKKIRQSRKKHCEQCKRKVAYCKEDAKSILEFSKRTQQKILKRAKIKCVLCGWNEAACDIHHIVPKKKGGTDSHDNLVVVCPNCHRTIHTFPKKFPVEQLRKKCMAETFKNWKFYYLPKGNKLNVVGT